MARSRGAPRHARGRDITHHPRLPPQPAVARLIAYFMQPGAMGELRIQGFGAEVSVMVPSGFGVWASATLLHVAHCGGLFHAHGMQGFGLSIVTEVVGNQPPPMAAAAILAALASPPPLDFAEPIGDDWDTFKVRFTAPPGKVFSVGSGSQRRWVVALFSGERVVDVLLGRVPMGYEPGARPKAVSAARGGKGAPPHV